MTNDVRSGPLDSTLLARRTIRRAELRRIVPLANTTIYEMECRGEFPKRFFLTPRCVVWDLAEVYAWLDARKQPAAQLALGRAPAPNVHLRRRRPLKSHPGL
jgi:prophage regulatory protein